jgi:multidrug efflux pump subunit AcrA (membrane-fusion protein)
MAQPVIQTQRRPRILPILARAGVSIAFIAAGVGIYVWLYETRPQPPASDPSTTGRLRLVVTEPVEQPAGRRFRAFGQARAIEVADVPARVAATVAVLHPNYREGATVAEGEALVSLDDSDFRRQLAMADEAMKAIDAQLAMLDLDERTIARALELAEEDAKLADDDLGRVRRAAEQDAARAREVDRARGVAILAERAVLAAREAVQKLPIQRTALRAEKARQDAARGLAQLAVERSTVRAPIAGTVQVAQLDVGESAAPGVLVARIVNPARIEIPILLPSQARQFVHAGDAVTLRADRSGSEPVAARVTRIAPEDDAVTRTMTVYAETAGSAQLAPGSFVEAEVAATTVEPRTLVPRRAVSAGRIFIIRDGVARGVPVEIEFASTGKFAPALPDTEWLVLKETLPKDALVVLDGSRRIREGAPVVPVRAGETAEPAGKHLP